MFIIAMICKDFCFVLVIVGSGCALVLTKDMDVLVRQGHYSLKINLHLTDLEKGGEFLRKAVSNYGHTCDLLANLNPRVKCARAALNLKRTVSHFVERENFIRSFFNKREKRFWHGIGAMDTDDLARIDTDLDKLRGNEEQIKHTIEHQTEVVNSIFNFVNNSMTQIDSKMRSLFDKLQLLTRDTNSGIHFQNNIREILYLENELSDLGFWIQLLSENMRKHQSIFTNLVLGQNKHADLVMDIIEPSQLIRTLEQHDVTLPKDVTFPRRRDGNIFPEIINSIGTNHNFIDRYSLEVILQIPLVNRQMYSAYMAVATPGLKKNVVTMLLVNPEVMLLNEGSSWGHVMNKKDLDKCVSIHDTKLCEMPAIVKDLSTVRECVAEFYFRNSTSGCELRKFKVNRNMWFQSPEPNVWDYIAPSSINLEIIQGDNLTHLTVSGVGKIRLVPDMIVRTKEVVIHYKEQGDRIGKEVIVHDPPLEEVSYNVSDYKMDDLPKRISIFSSRSEKTF